MIKYTDLNVFNTNAQVIVNTINCVGFMGKGLALEYSLRYPDLLNDYKNKCNNKEIKVGKIYYYQSGNQLIVNFPTKKDYKFSSKIIWIEEGLKDFVNTYKKYNIKSIAFPLLGCRNGGLDIEDVLKLMEKYLKDLDIEVYICYDNDNPEGKELEMINNFKKCNIDILSLKYIKLTEKQKDNLKRLQNSIIRFYSISKTEGIGFETYRKLYDIFYNNKYIENNKIDNYKQESLF